MTIVGMDRRRRLALCALIEDLGGGRDLEGDPLNATEELIFDRALDLAAGRRKPSEGERPAYERFRRRAT